MAMRIYVVRDPAKAQSARLVKASTQAQAVRHCHQHLKCSVASQDELVDLMSQGVKVEECGRAEPED